MYTFKVASWEIYTKLHIISILQNGLVRNHGTTTGLLFFVMEIFPFMCALLFQNLQFRIQFAVYHFIMSTTQALPYFAISYKASIFTQCTLIEIYFWVWPKQNSLKLKSSIVCFLSVHHS